MTSTAARDLGLAGRLNIRAHALIAPFPLSKLVIAVPADNGKAALDCALEKYFLRWLRVRHGRKNVVESCVRPVAIDNDPIGAPNCLDACVGVLGGRTVLRKEKVQKSHMFMTRQK